MPRPFVVTVMLPNFGPIAPGCMTQKKRAVAGPLLGFNIFARLGFQFTFDDFGFFPVPGFGIARKSTAPDIEVEAVCFRVGTLED